MKSIFTYALLLTLSYAQEPIQEQPIEAELIPQQMLASDPYLTGRSQDNFVAQQKVLISGKLLSLWGV